jgi:fructokinase
MEPQASAGPVLCFGEILWDFLPAGLFPGGAPFNVGYHLHRHGVPVFVVSAVGRDVLGDELLRRLHAWGLPVDHVAVLDALPTGYVRADVSDSGDAHYSITADVAWDAIPVDAGGALLARADGAGAVVFGSLAQRSLANRDALDRLLAAAPRRALRVFDVNLRPPHDDAAVIWSLAARASVLKLNATEAARLARDGAESPGSEEADARALAARAGCACVCVTAGARGAGLLRNGAWTWEDARAVEVADTVGSGDAFLASLVASFLHGRSSDGELIARACRIGEWVATRRGATPACDPSTPS